MGTVHTEATAQHPTNHREVLIATRRITDPSLALVPVQGDECWERALERLLAADDAPRIPEPEVYVRIVGERSRHAFSVSTEFMTMDEHATVRETIERSNVRLRVVGVPLGVTALREPRDVPTPFPRVVDARFESLDMTDYTTAYTSSMSGLVTKDAALARAAVDRFHAESLALVLASVDTPRHADLSLGGIPTSLHEAVVSVLDVDAHGSLRAALQTDPWLFTCFGLTLGDRHQNWIANGALAAPLQLLHDRHDLPDARTKRGILACALETGAGLMATATRVARLERFGRRLGHDASQLAHVAALLGVDIPPESICAQGPALVRWAKGVAWTQTAPTSAAQLEYGMRFGDALEHTLDFHGATDPVDGIDASDRLLRRAHASLHESAETLLRGDVQPSEWARCLIRGPLPVPATFPDLLEEPGLTLRRVCTGAALEALARDSDLRLDLEERVQQAADGQAVYYVVEDGPRRGLATLRRAAGRWVGQHIELNHCDALHREARDRARRLLESIS